MAYKGMMLSGVPNCAFTVGYTNASWTLKADLTSEYVCRLLAYMDAHGYRVSVPAAHRSRCHDEPLLDFTSGYVLRSLGQFPKQGSKEPWRVRQNYLFDLKTIRKGDINDGTMRFSRSSARTPSSPNRPEVAGVP